MKKRHLALIDLSNPKEPKLKMATKGVFLSDLRDFKDQQRVWVQVETYYRQRTPGQNSFYWYIFVQEQIECFKEFWGETYSKDEIHEWNKANFWGEEKVIEATGELIKTPASSTSQNTVQWEEKLENIRQWFRQKFSWEISYPLEQGELNLKH